MKLIYYLYACALLEKILSTKPYTNLVHIKLKIRQVVLFSFGLSAIVCILEVREGTVLQFNDHKLQNTD